ncbi:MAG: NrtA/SsuA/CpmA family ABC transporter substrate-binding protein [Oscillospiraceae bacterium]
MKKFLAITLAAAMLITTVGCGAPKKETEKTPVAAPPATETAPTFTVDKIGVTYVKSPLNVPSIVEKEKGMFAESFGKYSLPVEYSNLTTGPEQTSALASGDLQFLNAVGATSVILAASNEADIKIISMYSRSPKAFMLFTGNPEIKSAADLKGKKVAGPKGTILHELLLAYLATANLTEKDIEFISMGLPDSQAALVANQVDCALLAGPGAYTMQKNGSTVLTTGEGLVDATIVVAASDKFIQANRPLVDTFLESQKSVLDYIAANHDEVVKMTAKETELPTEAVEEMMKMYDFNMDITDKDMKSLEKTEQFLFDNGMTEKRVDVQNLIMK